MEAIGVLSSCVTALMKLSCCSFRRISRRRKIVLRTSPAEMAPKKITPRKTLIPSRQLRMIQPKPTATATPARPTPRTRNVMVALRRLVMRIARFYSIPAIRTKVKIEHSLPPIRSLLLQREISMNSQSVCRLDAGQFHGHVVRSREVGGFRLTEDV